MYATRSSLESYIVLFVMLFLAILAILALMGGGGTNIVRQGADDYEGVVVKEKFVNGLELNGLKGIMPGFLKVLQSLTMPRTSTEMCLPRYMRCCWPGSVLAQPPFVVVVILSVSMYA